jgi:hypothetical protein
MRAALLLLVVVVLGGLLLLYGPAALLPGDTEGGIHRLPLLDALTLLGQERERGEQLATRLEATQRCIAAKDRVVADVVGGRVGLLEAAAAFRHWHRGVPGYDEELIRQFFPGQSEEESLCLAVIYYVEKALDNRPEEQAELVANLRSQLKRHQERGTLRLPGPGRLCGTPSRYPE